jgi:mono/diheme cytochrome c family protein
MSSQTTTAIPTAPESAEPRAVRRAIPVWLVILLFVLLYWGMVYFDLRGGWFDEHVYAPFRSIDQVVAYQPPRGDADFLLKGKQLFSMNCAVCHMEAGTGNPANGCPPLAGSDWVAAPGPGRIIRLVSKGATGPIDVSGKTYNPSVPMLAIGDQLPGDEQQKSESIAAILSYIRATFGNNASLVTTEQVVKVRAGIKDRKTYFTAEELKAAPEAL